MLSMLTKSFCPVALHRRHYLPWCHRAGLSDALLVQEEARNPLWVSLTEKTQNQSSLFSSSYAGDRNSGTETSTRFWPFVSDRKGSAKPGSGFARLCSQVICVSIINVGRGGRACGCCEYMDRRFQA